MSEINKNNTLVVFTGTDLDSAKGGMGRLGRSFWSGALCDSDMSELESYECTALRWLRSYVVML